MMDLSRCYCLVADVFDDAAFNYLLGSSYLNSKITRSE